MKRNLYLLAAAVFLLAAPAAFASEPKNDNVWSDQAEFSFVKTTGNTDTTSMAGKNTLSYRFLPRATGTWRIGGLYGADSGVTTAEQYASELRLDYMHTERVYTFVMVGWNKDRFAGIDQRYYGGGGAGYKFLLGPKHFLLGEAGMNYTQENYTDNTSSGFLTGRLFGKYEYAITKKNRLSQSVEYLYDFSDSSHFKVNAETAVIAALTDIFSLKAAYTVRHDHKPVPADLEKTDTGLTVALVANL
jgi:putative salt-induced outer membrane protein